MHHIPDIQAKSVEGKRNNHGLKLPIHENTRSCNLIHANRTIVKEAPNKFGRKRGIYGNEHCRRSDLECTW